jgi:septal ring factor EnvC (AmiA/AmiB activator)
VRGRPVALTLALAALLLFAPALSADEQDLKEKELAKLRESISALRQDLKSDRSRHSQLQEDLERIERRLGRTSAELRTLKGKLRRQGEKLAKLEARRDRLEATLGDQRGYLARQVRAAYAMGRQEYVKILLNQEDPAALGRVLAYYDYLNRARSHRIQDILDTLEELDSVKRRIARETERLTVLRASRKAQLTELEHSRAARTELMARLERQLSSKGARLEGLLADEKELQQLLEALAHALTDIPDKPGRTFAELRGKLQWPTRGSRLASFGTPRASGKVHWRGVLIRAAEGQPVRAVSHGRVAFADWLRGYGLLVIIDHGDGYMSLYGHNQTLYKETGDWVEADEVIATVGNTGGQDQTALYFEIRHNGQPTDPAQWCRTS